MKLTLTLLSVFAYCAPSFGAQIYARQFPPRTWTIANSCPDDITLYTNVAFEPPSLSQVLPSGQSITVTYDQIDMEFFTDANSLDPSTSNGTRAKFELANPDLRQLYFMVVDPNNFNVGLSILPSIPASDGFCPEIECDDVTCSSAFPTPGPENLFIGPPPTPEVPTPPMYNCPEAAATFTVTFCPSGTFPS